MPLDDDPVFYPSGLPKCPHMGALLFASSKGFDRLLHGQLHWLIANDMPLELVAKALVEWNGEMQEEDVRRLGEYLDPGRPRRQGRPKSKHSEFQESMIMHSYFYLLQFEQAYPDPVKKICELYGFKSRKFQGIRARHHKKLARDFRLYVKQTQRTPEQAIQELCESEGITRDYWDKNIRPLI